MRRSSWRVDPMPRDAPGDNTDDAASLGAAAARVPRFGAPARRAKSWTRQEIERVSQKRGEHRHWVAAKAFRSERREVAPLPLEPTEAPSLSSGGPGLR